MPTSRLIGVFLLFWATTGCSSNDQLEQDLDLLKERVVQLEGQVRRLEGKPPKGKAKGKHKGKAKKGKHKGKAKGKHKKKVKPSSVTVINTLHEVALNNGKRRFVLPHANVPAGVFTIEVNLVETNPPTPFGTLTLTPASEITLDCDEEEKICTPTK